jgi:hypothetical protein
MTTYEVAARETKAAKLALVLARQPEVLDHPTISEAPAEFREAVAKLAGAKAPSQLTWDRAIELAMLRVRKGEAA